MQWLPKRNLLSAIMHCNHESYTIFHVNKIASPLYNISHVTSSFDLSDLKEEPFFYIFLLLLWNFDRIQKNLQAVYEAYFKTTSLQLELRLELVLRTLFYVPNIIKTR